jgi:flagellar biosynthetic protein FliR
VQFDLTQYLVAEVYAFLAIFCRVGSMIMLMPGLGDNFVPARIRLTFALFLSLAMTPLLSAYFREIPGSPLELFRLMSGEILFGVFIGLISRILLSSLHTAGMLISTQSSLASAMLFDPTQSTQGTALGNFMSIMALALIFASGLDHQMIRALADSYSVFTPGGYIPVEDMASYLTRLANQSFELAFLLSAPILVITLLLYVAGGIMSRLMPAMQIFYILVPIQLLTTFLVLATIISFMMLRFMDYFAANIRGFIDAGGF